MSRQIWNPDEYARNARFVSELGLPVLELLAPQPAERILDLGCGDGSLTSRLLERRCDVVGVDSSPGQVSAARARGVDARLGDASRLTFDNEFDAVFTNAVLHWINPPDAVLEGVHRALKPGGRFVGEFGGSGNVAAIEAALRHALERRGTDPRTVHPWYYPTAGEFRDKLEQFGFRVRSIETFARPTRLPGELVDWLATFAQSFAAVLPEADHDSFYHEVQAELRPKLCDADGHWTADYVRLRFAAVKP